jgi:hypothetical protein
VEVAQQRVDPGDLAEHRLEGGGGPVGIAADQGVLGFQAHRRDGIADLVGDARRQPADGGQSLGRHDARLSLPQPPAGGVQGVHQPVEFALAGAVEMGQILAVRARRGERGLQPGDPP